MTKITQLPLDTTPAINDLIALVNNATGQTSRMSVSDFSKIIDSLLNAPGDIKSTAAANAPAGWLLCDGSAISRSQYSALYTALGVRYGAGDGSTTFNLPDLRGRVIAGKDNMGGTAAGRLTNPANQAVTGMDGTILGNTGGLENHWHWQTFGYDGGAAYFAIAGNAPALGTGVGRSTVITNDRGIVSFGHSTTGARFDGTGESSTLQPTIILNYVIKT